MKKGVKMGKIKELAIEAADIYEKKTGCSFDQAMDWAMNVPLDKLALIVKGDRELRNESEKAIFLDYNFRYINDQVEEIQEELDKLYSPETQSLLNHINANLERIKKHCKRCRSL